MRNVRVAIWGFGAMGSGMARMLLKKKGVEIAGVCDRNPSIVGKDMYEVLSIDRKGRMPVCIKSNEKEVITEGSCDIVLVATDSHVKKAYDRLEYCLKQKANVICTAEEMAYPKVQSPELSEQLDTIAKSNGVTLLGTGINPGFVMDYLILALTGTCENIESIKATRVNDLSPFGSAVMQEQGVGISVEEFNKRNADGTLAGHIGFPESISMVAEGLGICLDKIEQTKEPIISNTYRKTEYAKIEPGSLSGIRQRGFGYFGGKIFIEMDHPQQIQPHVENVTTGDFIGIKGTPDINLNINPEIPGGIGTVAMCVNMIPHVINADPGLKTMLDLPVPRAMMGDMRELIKFKE
ncbi:2,4-diaminopentanoate dehydrogenase [Petroclostridium sp. X23]|uniref:2,4-diaminopentanoate dehydrogenase n=1 Tax=Petroclostridium sp. X23 TaxID=3045146 RepID=UPI0024AD8223|nr:2,4-diaminopentanoate dehydrogenase [Petroclostridium sp. X23]WHH61246.1 2,4-diaminopentanoate dehydrogenase [Petroclostridium sp. X23]